LSIEPNVDEIRTAREVAHRIGSRWSQVEIDDLTSHLFLWLVEHTKTLDRWRGETGGKGKLYVTLKREALKFCARETATKVGRPIDADNFYTEDVIERALPFIFEAWPETQVKQNPHTGQAQGHKPHEYGSALAILADISGTFYGLPNDLREVLEWRYRDGLGLDEIANLKEITKEGARQMVLRGIRRMKDKLAGERL
jgi:RNA polymerase sigma factor (sigma-70 family)